MTCQPCKIGWHAECENPEPIAGTDLTMKCCCWEQQKPVMNLVVPGNPFEHVNPSSDKFKANEDIQDQTSTGRKRAAILYPIPSVESGGMTCEWANLAFAGGGAIPIIGCRGNIIADIKIKQDNFWPGNVHHGPDKSTLNNEPNNVSRVCPTCVTGDARLLTEDLRWLRADELTVGTKLIGFSEDLRFGYNKFEPAVVESIVPVIKQGYELTMLNGDILVVSEDHKWVANRTSDQHTKWYTTKNFWPGYALKRLVKPWEEDNSREAGWFAGFLDGEGYLSGYNLGVGQTSKSSNFPTMQRMYNSMFKYTNDITETRRPANGKDSEAFILRMTRLSDILSTLGQVRPERLISKLPNFLYSPQNGREKVKSPIPASSREVVVKIKPIGLHKFYSIQTSSSTYIVEGYLSHNCHNRWHAMNDPLYAPKKSRPDAGLPYLPLSGEYMPLDKETLATDAELDWSEKYWSTPTRQRENLVYRLPGLRD